MKIVAGLGTIDDYDAYVRAGADELFIGYVPYSWQKNNELVTPLNRREVSYSNVNIGSQSELEILTQKIKESGVEVTIAINGLNYRPEQYSEIIEIIEKCYRNGFGKYIVADMGLLIHLNKSGLSKKLEIHVSGEFGEQNSYQLKLLESLGVSRIIYHRGTAIADMERMIKMFPNLEHEAFFMNEKCHFTGAYCNSLHCDEMVPMCRMPYELKCFDTYEKNEMKQGKCNGEFISGLGLFRKLEKIGISHLKIVGRGAYTEDMVRDIAIARSIVEGRYTDKSDDYVGNFYTEFVSN